MPPHHRMLATEKLSTNTVDNIHVYSVARNVIPAVAIIPKGNSVHEYHAHSDQTMPRKQDNPPLLCLKLFYLI